MIGTGESRRGYIRKVNFFEELTDHQADEIAAGLLTIRFKADETIFSYNEDGDSLYILMEGKVELFIEDYVGDKITLKVASPGDYFGELAVLGGGKRTATAKALEPCVCYELNRHQMLDFLHQKPNAAIAVLAALSKAISSTNSMLSSRISRNANQDEIAPPTAWQRVMHRVVKFCGSTPFLFLNILFFGFWFAWNMELIPGVAVFDPYPFTTLILMVAVEIVFLAIFILVSQSLRNMQDGIHHNIEYEVNLKADLEIAHLHEKMDRYQGENIKLLQALSKAYGI